MKRGAKKRRRSNEDVSNNGTEEECKVGTNPTDGEFKLSPALAMLHPELQLLIQKFSLQKPMTMLEMKKLLGLLIVEFNSHVPMVKQASKSVERLEQLEKANKELTDEKNSLLEDKAETGKENCVLRKEVARNQKPSIVIKNMPIHCDAENSNESLSQSTLQFRKLLSAVDLPNLKFNSVFRWKLPNSMSTPTKVPIIQAELDNYESRRKLMKKLYLLKNCPELSSISVQIFFPKYLQKELREKETICYMLRKEMNTRTRILMKNGNLIIHFLRNGIWILFDLDEPTNNEPANFANANWPKRVKKNQ